jgi:glycosyltransferase involved in cell wall biosynthesis
MKRLLVFNLMTDADDTVLGFTTDWLNALAARCESVDVITMQAGRLAVAPNVRVYSLGKEQGTSEPRRAWVFYRTLTALLQHQRYDAAFAHMSELFAVMGAPLLKLAGVPLTLWYAHKATPPLLRLAEKWVDHVVSASAESFRLPSRKLHIIGHGVDTERFTPPLTAPHSAALVERGTEHGLRTVTATEERSAASDSSERGGEAAFTLVSAGRIAPVKRLETIIAALDTLRGVDVRLRIVGAAAAQDAEYAARLREQAAGLPVEFVGAVTHAQMAQVYQQADALVNMSQTGSIDKAVLEAMACGLPVITANEAFQGMLAPWAETLLVPPESPELLPVRVRRLLALTPDERRAMGAALRQIVVDGHSLDGLIEQLMAILPGR